LKESNINAVVAILWHDNWNSYSLEKENISILKLKQMD